MNKEYPVLNVMVKVGGKPFRCSCGCNVFTKPMPDTRPKFYECNSCKTLYEGE